MTHNHTVEKMDKRVAESPAVIVSRIKSNIKKMEKVTQEATYKLRVEIGRDLLKLKQTVPDGEWVGKLRALGIATTSAHNWMKIAKPLLRSERFTSITEHLRKFNPKVALPRQSVNDFEAESAGKKILSGISTGIFVERTLTISKEKGLKKKMALELVDAGYRALSIKAHSDKGGSDEAMRRLTEVRTVLKDAIEDGDIYF